MRFALARSPVFKNYIKIALRNLRKYKGYSFINIAGLAIGLASCALIMLYVRDELSFDRYHQNAGRIYRVNLDAGIGGTFVKSATTAAPMAAALVQEFPEVANATRFWQTSRVLISYENNRFYEDFNWADSTVFALFDFPLALGDPRTALAQPNALVISEAMAEKYFGRENPLGKVLRYDNRVDYKVTGVMKNMPRQSHFRFDFLGSMLTQPQASSPRWVSNSFYTYLLLQPAVTPAQLEAKFPALIRKYVAPQIQQAIGKSFDEAIAAGAKWDYRLQALPEIYLHSYTQHEIGATSDIKYIYILTAIAVFVMLIAAINFMNLATARSANRAKEVGMRKVLGSVRGQLMKQFLSESVLMALLALLIALASSDLLLPLFNNLAGKELTLASGANAIFFLALFGVTLVVGLLAGVYPALVLSAFQPVAVLKGSLRSGAKSPWLRSALVVAQFAISIILLIGTGVVFQQLEYMRNKRLGFNKEQLVVLPIETGPAQQRYESFRQELLANPNILAVAASDVVPGRFEGDDAFRPEGAPQEVVYPLERMRVCHDFLTTFEMEVVSGRGFSRDFVTDTSEAVMINETAARRMGMTPESAVGKKLTEVAAASENAITRTIIGVVKDFHIEAMHRPIDPVVLFMQRDAMWRLSVRIRPENIPATLAFLQEKWQAFEPGYPWRYFFLDEDFGRFFQNEERQSKIFGSFTILAIAIACLGLFGLASFIAEQRTKEIGVRKVLGASVQQIILLLSKDFTKLVAIAFVMAAPAAYFVMNKWLQDFAYRTALPPGIFILAGLSALMIAWLTVSYQAIKAALTNPVESLRYE
jgi:putative ABC transport system permease protein